MIFKKCGCPQNNINDLKLNISTMLEVQIDNDWIEENVVSPFSRIYYIKSGSGKIVTESGAYILKPGTVYLIPVGMRFSHYPDGKLEKLYFHFNIMKPDGYDLLRSFGDIGVIERGNEYINEIYSMFESEDGAHKFMLKTAVQSDICDFIKVYGIADSAKESYSDTVYRAIKIIVNNPSIQLNNSVIAGELFVSESRLKKQFKKETGKTVGEYIDRMVFYGAQIDLIETEKSIAEISEYYGFCDRFYFSRRFKQLFGETPVQYRKRFKKCN